jgi:glycosyltransferase involved in cell wall biosynthesis
MMKNSPLISIIIPVYMAENFLSTAVDSLLNQTYKNLEIILIDDGSPDQSGVLCDEYSEKDDRVITIHQIIQGAAAALNKGIAVSKGQYLMFLDNDDWLHPKTCEEAINIALKENVDVVFWPFIKEFENKSQKENSVFLKNELFVDKRLEWLKRRMVGLMGNELINPTRTDAFNSGWGKLYVSEIIKGKAEWTDTNMVGSSDVIFNIQVFRNVKKAYFMNKYYTHYRKYNPHSLTRNYKFTLLPKYLNLFEKIQDQIIEHKLNEEYETALKNRISVSVINHLLSITTPDHNLSFRKMKDYIKEVLTHPVYKNALKDFDTSFLPIHWKLFFIACKSKNISTVLVLGKIMRKLR